MDNWDSATDKAIRNAIERGEFSNLPGKGKPIRWNDNPFADPYAEAAYSMLKNAGYTLPWIEERQEIERDLDAARRALLRTWRWAKHHSSGSLRRTAEEEWARAADEFHAAVAAINRRIRTHNLKVPSEGFQRLPANAQREIELLTGQAE